MSILSVNLWLTLYWISGLFYNHRQQIFLMCLSLGLFNILNDFSLVFILVSQLLRSTRYVTLFGKRGIFAVMIFAGAIFVYNFTKCYIDITWLKYVGIAIAVLTYLFLITLSYQRNSILRPLVKKLAALYFIVILMAASSRHVEEPKLFMLSILVGVNDYSRFFKFLDRYKFWCS